MRFIDAVMIVIITMRLIKIIVVMLVKKKTTSEYSSYEKEEIEYDYSKFSDEDCLAPHYENDK